MSFRRVQFRKKAGRTPDLLRKSHRHETEDERRARRYREERAYLAEMADTEDDFDADDRNR